ncbi:zf-DHHC-domain-containing protein [Conidiobolus coronatus NRRL 28638]|uniref:Palmitoyltransferase n=1 Tax=Conidiobolus coronatus (strain ATCC 28846 / CBS 209.66 / NRRL 28638) TaxID=796925 RepID=A0A137P7I2_CONC2|nr:zf-DHHC-domain-containing protein [Conidiobolus coronatus NRRL 28638]|eukprot:KXN70929.1 zf-DHHC-domain-containing protein [Conidiobolus coronatus NRRL 28638]
MSLALLVAFFSVLAYLRISDPGTVTRQNLDNVKDRYEMDGLIYYKKFCTTCKWNRPPRTKHCKLCNRCHLMMDHHCIWIDNCVASSNHKYFLLYLIIMIVASVYGSFLFYRILSKDFNKIKLSSEVRYTNVITGEVKTMETWIMVIMVLQKHIQLTALHLLLSIVGLFLTLFLISHLMSTVKGMTEVETNKWSYIQSLVKKGNVKYIDPNDPDQKINDNPIEEDEDEEDYLTIYHPDQLNYLYDQGSYLNNFMHMVFPPPLSQQPKY